MIISSGKVMVDISKFVLKSLQHFACSVFLTWQCILLLCSGDVHPNLGPHSSSSSSASINTSSSNMSTNILYALNVSHYLSFVHYNVQSIMPKLDILHTELIAFDILAFSETWLNPAIETDDLILQS